jgi:hypothetical protein
LLLNTLTLCSSPNIRSLASDPYKTTGKSIGFFFLF